MLTEIIYAIIQSATEFLPVSSSGHLALLSNIFDQPNLFLFTALHLASLIAVVIFTRKEILQLLTFDKLAKKMWLYLIIATIPATLIGLIFHNQIESTFSSYAFLGFAFIFTGIILISTKFIKPNSKPLTAKNSFLVGIFQAIAIFPGVSRSGMTISAGIFSGLNKEKSAKFSFLLLIPITLGAFILEASKTKITLDANLIIPFIICVFTSLLFLNFLMKIIKKNKFWMFGIYCLILGIISLGLWLF